MTDQTHLSIFEVVVGRLAELHTEGGTPHAVYMNPDGYMRAMKDRDAPMHFSPMGPAGVPETYLGVPFLLVGRADEVSVLSKADYERTIPPPPTPLARTEGMVRSLLVGLDSHHTVRDLMGQPTRPTAEATVMRHVIIDGHIYRLTLEALP